MSFVVPKKEIHSDSDFTSFQKSGACKEILDFVKLAADSVVGSSIADDIEVSTVVGSFCEFMTSLFNLVDEIPPLKQPMRFGNKAFRIWHERMIVESSKFLTALLPANKVGATIELAPYIWEMFGNTTRIDYGTGHELNFAVFFLILLKLEVIQKSDLKAVILRGFVSYVKVMRRLQVEYMLEPAGSHGVWGLDDYHCLLFLWGAAQLATIPTVAHAAPTATSTTTVFDDSIAGQRRQERAEITPSSVLDLEVLREYSDEYLYLEGVAFIRKIKASAPFSETSPMLYDISAVSDWAKVCSGLMRLFQGEVLLKFPVMQHLLFGSLLVASWAPPPAPTEEPKIGESKA